MAILNPISSKFTLATGVAQEIYYCPPGKSHALVDLSFLKDSLSGSSVVSVALTKESNPANLTTLDYFLDDIEMVETINFGELNKVIVGTGERLIAKVLSGLPVNVRVSGVEENNPKVLKAGKLAALAVAGTSQTELFSNQLPNVSYVSGSLTLYNPHPTNDAEVEMWITSQALPTDMDKVLRVSITPQDTTIIENVLLLPNEKILVRSNQVNCEYFILGLTVSSM